MLVLIGLLPATYALNLRETRRRREAQSAARQLEVVLTSHQLAGLARDAPAARDTDRDARRQDTPSARCPVEDRWRIRSTIFQLERQLETQRSSEPGLGSHGAGAPAR